MKTSVSTSDELSPRRFATSHAKQYASASLLPQAHEQGQCVIGAGSGEVRRKATLAAVEGSARVAQLAARAQAIADSPRSAAQRQRNDLLFGDAVHAARSTLDASTRPGPQLAARPNQTGLPDQLKSGIEAMSGMPLDQVRVHYNSAQPARLNAHAYAQGSTIHLAPGQEGHLPHEAWHVVQQARGQVAPTMHTPSGVAVNDDAGLEREADVMGARAMQMKTGQGGARSGAQASPASGVRQYMWKHIAGGMRTRFWQHPSVNRGYDDYMRFMYGRRQLVRGMEIPELDRLIQTGTLESKAMREMREATARGREPARIAEWGDAGRATHLGNSYQPKSQYVSAIEQKQFEQDGNHFGTVQVPLELTNRGFDMEGPEPQVLVEGGTRVHNRDFLEAKFRAKLAEHKARRTRK